MKLQRKSLALATTILSTAALLLAQEAIAAPALVKNVDEAGRMPWDTRSQILPNAGGCYASTYCSNYVEGAGFAMFDLPPVPAGKRWVVQMATGSLVSGQGRITQIELKNSRGALVFDGLKWIFSGPFASGTDFSSVTYSANLFATFGPGETPTVRVTGNPNLIGYSVIVFSGYLIDAQ